jgi:hypothetical protein
VLDRAVSDSTSRSRAASRSATINLHPCRSIGRDRAPGNLSQPTSYFARVGVIDRSHLGPIGFGVVGPTRARLSRTRQDIADGLVPSRSVATKTRLIRGHDKITQTA